MKVGSSLVGSGCIPIQYAQENDLPHRLFGIPELLENIFEHADNPTRVTGALINKTFSEASLDVLWEEIPSLFPLLKVMGSLEFVHSSRAWNFRTPPTIQGWKRYVSYARRVRILTQSDDRGETPYNPPKALSPHVISLLMHFAEVDSTFLLPNLKSIKWEACEPPSTYTLSQVIPFVSPSVQEMEIRTSPPFTNSDVIHILQSLSGIPDLHLSKFRLLSTCPIEVKKGFVDSFLDFLAQQKGMVHVSLPTIYPMEKGILTETIGQLEHLTALDITLPVRRLSECAGILAALVDLRPALTILKVVVIKSQSAMGLKGGVWGALTFDSIGTILGFKCLTALDISYENGLVLTDEEIEFLGKAWPSMKKLYLCNRGNHGEKKGVAAGSLETFAASFPNLVELGLYIQAGSEPPPKPYTTSYPSSAAHVFPKNFSLLDVGSSSIYVEHVAAMAGFLIALSPPDAFVVKSDLDDQWSFGPGLKSWRGVRDTYVTGINIRRAMEQSAKCWHDQILAENVELKTKFALLEECVPFELASQETFRQVFQPIVAALKENLRASNAGPSSPNSV